MNDNGTMKPAAAWHAIEQPEERALQRLRRAAGFRSTVDFARAAGIDEEIYGTAEHSRIVPANIAARVAGCLESRGVEVPDWLSEGKDASETICSVSLTRDDLLDAINRHLGTSLRRGGETESLLDDVAARISNRLNGYLVETAGSYLDDLLPDGLLHHAEAESVVPERAYRLAVMRALSAAGWDVRGNDTGTTFALSRVSGRTERRFRTVLDLSDKDPACAGDWVRASFETASNLALWSGGPAHESQPSVAHDVKAFASTALQSLPSVVLGAVREVVPPGYDDDRVADWYMRMFPDDELGPEIDKQLTFEVAAASVSLGPDFYDVLGSGDTLVRERVFQEIAARCGVGYAEVYDSWLSRTPMSEVTVGQQNEPLHLRVQVAEDDLGIAEPGRLASEVEQER